MKAVVSHHICIGLDQNEIATEMSFQFDKTLILNFPYQQKAMSEVQRASSECVNVHRPMNASNTAKMVHFLFSAS